MRKCMDMEERTLFDGCPGSASHKTPTLSIKSCPECGKEVEIFSNDIKVTCDNCGFVVHNNIVSCARWCKYAKECLGEEAYKRLTETSEE